MQKSPKYGNEDSVCLKGYLKSFYLKSINRRSDLIKTCECFQIMHILFCLFITPLYLEFISNFRGFLVPQKQKKENMKI